MLAHGAAPLVCQPGRPAGARIRYTHLPTPALNSTNSPQRHVQPIPQCHGFRNEPSGTGAEDRRSRCNVQTVHRVRAAARAAYVRTRSRIGAARHSRHHFVENTPWLNTTQHAALSYHGHTRGPARNLDKSARQRLLAGGIGASRRDRPHMVQSLEALRSYTASIDVVDRLARVLVRRGSRPLHNGLTAQRSTKDWCFSSQQDKPLGRVPTPLGSTASPVCAKYSAEGSRGTRREGEHAPPSVGSRAPHTARQTTARLEAPSGTLGPLRVYTRFTRSKRHGRPLSPAVGRASMHAGGPCSSLTASHPLGGPAAASPRPARHSSARSVPPPIGAQGCGSRRTRATRAEGGSSTRSGPSEQARLGCHGRLGGCRGSGGVPAGEMEAPPDGEGAELMATIGTVPSTRRQGLRGRAQDPSSGRHRHHAGHRQGLPQPARFRVLSKGVGSVQAGCAWARCRARSTCRCRSRPPSSDRRRSMPNLGRAAGETDHVFALIWNPRE